MEDDATLVNPSPVPATVPSHICPTGQQRIAPPEDWVQSVPAYSSRSSTISIDSRRAETSARNEWPLSVVELTRQHDPLLQQLAPPGQHPLLLQHVSRTPQDPVPHAFCRLRILRTALDRSRRGGVLENVFRIPNAGAVIPSSRCLIVARGVTKGMRTAIINSRVIL